MENITLKTIVAITKGSFLGSEQALQQQVSSICIDSRKAAPGALFAAIAGERVDGHSFIPQAAAAGACAAIGQAEITDAPIPYIRVANTELALGDIARFYRKQLKAKIIGISGSVGKTTCKEMLAAVLSQKFPLLKTEGNLNNQLGVPLTLFNLNSSHQLAVVEMGISHFGEMDYLGTIAQPDFAVFTNAGDAHLEHLQDRAGVVRAKTEMVAHMQPGGTIYINADDPHFSAYQPPENINRCTFGLSAEADIRATDCRDTEQGFCCRIEGIEFCCPAQGKHLVYSILPAVALGRKLGLSTEQLQAGVASFRAPQGRGNIIRNGKLTIIDSSYNANPSSMAAALDALANMQGRRVAILGDMYELGENSAALHAEVGAYATSRCQLLISCGSLAADMQAALHFAAVDELILALPQLVQAGDCVLVKSSNALQLSRVVEALQQLQI